MQKHVTEYAIAISLFANCWWCLAVLRLTCWWICTWQTDAGITAEPWQQARCNTMPPSSLPSGFFSAELPRRSAQSSFEYERPRRAHTVLTDYRQTVRMFVTVLHCRLCLLVFNIRIMLLICHLAIWSRGVSCPHLWRENSANIDFKLERFFIAVHIRAVCLR